MKPRLSSLWIVINPKFRKLGIVVVLVLGVRWDSVAAKRPMSCN